MMTFYSALSAFLKFVINGLGYQFLYGLRGDELIVDGRKRLRAYLFVTLISCSGTI